MKLLVAIIISILVTTKARSIKDNETEDYENFCEGVIIDGVYHEIEVLKTELDRPYLLAMDHASDNLYFSYSVTDDDKKLQSARLDIKTKDFEIITGVQDDFAQTVDPKTQEVYIGGSDGIYKYDRKNKKTEFYAAKGKSVWALFFKDVLYFSEFPSGFLYTVSNGETVRYKDLEDTTINDHFVIDKENTMFYSNESGLYSQKKGTKKSILIKQSESICGITVDLKDNVYACVENGIYVVKKTEAELVKVIDTDDAYGLAFDSHNNIVFAGSTELVLLKPNMDKSC